jgi:DNA polymerase-3 subunit alpha
MGFAGYFLVVSDFIVYAKENNIPVGPGRGSCAGSLVAYALRITELDPIKNQLLFERFLNPDRVSLPDIDVDFCINGRDKVIEYVVNKYGKDHVAQIATFGTLKAKAAIKDVGRVLGIPYAETDRVAQLVPAPRQGFDYPLAEALKMEPRLKEYADNEGKELISLAMKLEGLTRHASTHAAGVVIGDRPLIDLLPMMVDKDGKDVTQYSMSYVEKVGLVKFDFLGLKTLTVIKTACDLIEQSRGIKIDVNELPLDDPKTYATLCAGNTTGVFQLESGGITEMTVRLKPSVFNDLVAILALYRPGPLDAGMVDHYIERKHGREPVNYLHPLMQESLADTYGIILYQEQIMQLARVLAGYSLAEADILRKAMGKKNPEEMAKQRQRFMQGTEQQKIPQKLASEIFDQMETFARYGFNRSHSAAYAMISFQTAYLKTHYQCEFMAALMNHEMDDSDKTLKNLNECRKAKIEVLPPNVNLGAAGFSVNENKIRYGLEAVKGVGEKAVESIINEREKNGPFTSIENFMERVDLSAVNRRVVEGFVKCGAFDSFNETRRDMFEALDELFRWAQGKNKDRNSSQLSLFGDEELAVSKPRWNRTKQEWPINQKLSFEREALGFYISGHPLEKFRAELKKFGASTTAEVKAAGSKPSVRMGGVVTALKLKNTKKGDRYASFTFEDWLGTMEALVWPDVYRQIQTLISADDPVLVTGKTEITEEKAVLIVDKMESLITIRDRTATQGVMALGENDNFQDKAQTLMSILTKHRGRCPVKVIYETADSKIDIILKDAKEAPVCVEPSEHLCEAVEQIFGRPVLSFM